MTELTLNRHQYLELEKLHLGAFAPLQGFMTEGQFHSVVDSLRLPDGEVFPLPVMLDLSADDKDRVKGRPRVTLCYEGEEVGEIEPQSLFNCDKRDVAMKVFGSDDKAHPGVAFLNQMQDWFVGGPVRLTKRLAIDVSVWELTPEQTRAEFKRRGWQTVVGFQTRNVPHRAHEYLQRVALEQVDGLFIQPLVGWKKEGDYTADAIMAGYSTLIEAFYPKDRVLLGILSTAMRYAGPREAVFHALVRRNYGCTHFVVGRDHAGVGDYYGKYEAHDLTRRFDGDLGIQVMRLHGPYHCRRCGGIVTEQTCQHLETALDDTRQISGTDIRELLTSGSEPDAEIMRPEVLDALSSVPVFIEGSD